MEPTTYLQFILRGTASQSAGSPPKNKLDYPAPISNIFLHRFIKNHITLPCPCGALLTPVEFSQSGEIQFPSLTVNFLLH